MIGFLLLVFLFVPALAGPAEAPRVNKTAKENELERVNADLDQGRAHAEALAKEIEALKSDRARLDRALIATAARIKEREASLSASERRLGRLDARESAFSTALADRRTELSSALAAMQRLGRSPAPALMAHPDDALAAIRAALLLGSVIGDLKRRAEALAADLAEAAALRRRIARSREALVGDAAALAEEQQRLARILAEKRRLQTRSQRELAKEKARLEQLAAQARSLEELIARMKSDMKRPVVASQATFTPSIPFTKARGRLMLPVSGQRVRRFGETDRLGTAAKGMSIATRPGARVTAPSDGEVVFGGRFRSYGQLLIINAGDGYHIVLAGMERIEVAVGQFVLAGEPVAVMGTPPPDDSPVLAGRVGQPILYVEFRKDGAAIDPTPWWASKSLEKVRG